MRVLGLLGRHVVGRPQQVAAAGEMGLGSSRLREVKPRQPQVEDLDGGALPAAHQQVGGLEIAMYQAAFVSVLQAECRLANVRARLPGIERAVAPDDRSE